MPEPTGPDRIREAIQRDRGGHLAPQKPVNVCGDPDPNAWRADDPRWFERTHPPAPERSIWQRIDDAITDALFCPGCWCLRIGPGHLSRKLAGIDCRHA